MKKSKDQNLLWYVIYTRPKSEKKIFAKLQKKKIETFLPLQKVMRQWSDRKKKIEVPLFPNYLFVHISSLQRWNVLSVDGVVRFLQFDGKSAIISETEINTIRGSLSRNPEVSHERFHKGDQVVISQGPLKSLEGILVNVKGKKRLAIRIDTIDRSILVDVSPGDLSKLHQSTKDRSIRHL